MAEQKNQVGMILVALLAVAIVFASGVFMAREGATGRRIITTPKAPQPIGPYSQAVLNGNTLYISGQLGINPVTGTLPENIEDQTRQCLANLQAILNDAGMDFSHVVLTHIFLKDIRDFQKVNDIYAGCFKGGFPARATVQIAALPKDGKVEIEMIACR